MELSRRDFLKVSAGAAGATGLMLLNPASPALGRDSQTQVGKAMLIDITKCISCWSCYAACKSYNGLPETATPDPADPPPLSPRVWTTLYPVENQDGWSSRKTACNHCTNAACVEVCSTGALSYNPLGFVQYDRAKCSGCGYCAKLCPFGVPQMEVNIITGAAVMDKCTFCPDRVTKGEPPACAAACPTEAIKFGQRSELLIEGEQRAADLRQTRPEVVMYGGDELDGLHVMYVLDDRPEVYGLPAAPEVPAAVTVRDIFRSIGQGAAVVVLLGLGFNYLVARLRTGKGERQ